MSNATCALEITVLSGEGLRVDRRRPLKKKAYVVVRTDSRNAQSTRPDADGGSYPEWNEKLDLVMPAQSRFLTVEVNSGQRVVGTARIPASDFVGGYTPANYLHFLSYRLRDFNGERNGIINLSVRVKGGVNNTAAYSRPWMGIPEAEKVSVSGGGVVTGIPVWHRYQV